MFKSCNVYRRNRTRPMRLRSAKGFLPHPERARLLPYLSIEPQFDARSCLFHNLVIAQIFLAALPSCRAVVLELNGDKCG